MKIAVTPFSGVSIGTGDHGCFPSGNERPCDRPDEPWFRRVATSSLSVSDGGNTPITRGDARQRDHRGVPASRTHGTGSGRRDGVRPDEAHPATGAGLEDRFRKYRPFVACDIRSTGVDDGTAVAFSPGDHVLTESESTERAPRRGVVKDVITRRPHLRCGIRWADGRESIYTPADGALRPDESAGRSA